MPTFEAIQEEIAGMLDVPDEELTPEQRATMDAYLDELAGQEAAKVDGFAQFIRIQSGLADACKKEAQRLAKKGRAAENRIAWLKGRYLSIMGEHGLKRVKGNVYSLNVRRSEAVSTPVGAPELMQLERDRPDLVIRKIDFAPNKEAIREAIKAGQEVPGCSIVEHFSLQIR